MQTSLMFVDLKPLGVTPNSQKIAIKMPEGADKIGANGDSGFSEMINALMAITPEQLQSSFGEMEWVKVQGESSGYAPLLDLSAAQASGTEMAQMLFGELAQNNLQQSTPLGLNPNNISPLDGERVGFGKTGLDDERVGFGKTGMEQLAAQDPKQHPDLSKGTHLQSVLNPIKEGVSQTAVVSTTTEAAQTGADPVEQGLASNIGEELNDTKPIRNKLDGVQQIAGRTQMQPSHSASQTNVEAVAKSMVNEDELIQKGHEEIRSAKVSSENNASNPKDQTTPAFLPEEITSRASKPNDPGAARVAAIQNNDKVNFTSEQATDQQFGDRNDADPKHILRQAARARQPSEEMRQNFNAVQGDVASDASTDESDPLTGGRQDNRVLFQQVVSRLKGAPVQSVEYASSQHESAPQTTDTQSNVIRQIVQRMSLHNQGSQSTMTLQLKPAFLGNVHMQISTDNQQVVVRMATESAAVKEMVEQGLQHLKTEMQHHGLEIDKFEVFVANDKEESHPGQDLAGFRQALKQRQQNAMKKGSNGDSEEHNEISEKNVEARRVTDNASEIDYFA